MQGAKDACSPTLDSTRGHQGQNAQTHVDGAANERHVFAERSAATTEHPQGRPAHGLCDWPETSPHPVTIKAANVVQEEHNASSDERELLS